MNQAYKSLLALAAALLLSPGLGAQNLPEGTYAERNGVAYRKSVSPEPDPVTGEYRISLESFVTGDVKIIHESVPSDIVLVLDVSASMRWPKGTATPTAKTTFSYNDIYYDHSAPDADTRKDYFVYTSGELYEQIYAEKETDGYYYLYVAPDNQKAYLTPWGNYSQRKSDAARSSDPDATLVTLDKAEGTKYDYFEGRSRLSALQVAVNAFIDEINLNDSLDIEGNVRAERLHNRISIVKFGSVKNTIIGEDYASSGTYNYTRIVKDFTLVENNVSSLKAVINRMIARGGTYTDYGLDFAHSQLTKAQQDRPNTAKTVLLFTDGEPTSHEDVNDQYQTGYLLTISSAQAIKKSLTYNAVIYTVGVFDKRPEETDEIYQFMQYTSSNYPNASSMEAPGDRDPNGDYYKDASGDVDLTEVFKTIARESGGTENPDVGTSSIVSLDIISDSFSLPKGTSIEDIKDRIDIYTAECRGDTTIAGKRYLTFREKVKAPDREKVTYDLFNKVTNSWRTVTADIDNAIKADPDTLHNSITTTGFNFADLYCGYDETHHKFRGYKLIIEFPISINEKAIGGPEVYTNENGSGIYVIDEEGQRQSIAIFNRPTVKIPVNIWIRKKGLEEGESAQFTIWRRPCDSEDVQANYRYFTSVVLTGNGVKEEADQTADKKLPMKKLLGLDPNYYYKIVEEGWSWTYSNQAETSLTTEKLEINPIIIKNEKKSHDIKNAEAIVTTPFTTTKTAQ